MENIREIKRRIGTLREIEHIAQAMKIISLSKLQKMRRRLESALPYHEFLQHLVTGLIAGEREAGNHPLVQVQAPGKPLTIVITADQGLGGGYNANILRLAREHLAETGGEVLALGLRGAEYLAGAGFSVYKKIPETVTDNGYKLARRLGEDIYRLVTDGSYREVFIVYTSFVTMVNLKPVINRLVPVQPMKDEPTPPNYAFEPGLERILDQVLRRYMEAALYYRILAARTAEHAARVSAMDSAVENADELIEKLNRAYHRARKGEITGEIAEIITAAQVLKEEVAIGVGE